LNEIALAHGTQVLVLFASQDIYGPTADKLFACYPDVRQVVLEEAGYLPWLQSPDAFRGELYAFFDC
jgi:pimeloyl-ACP methyl ester carboxylesterase